MAQVAGLTPGHPAFGIYQQIPGGYKSQFAQAVLSGQSPEQALQALWGGADPFGVIKSIGGTTSAAGVTLGGGAPGGGAAAGSALGGGGLAGQVRSQQQTAFDAANAANEARYQEILGGFGQQRGQMEDVFRQQSAALAGQGQAAQQDIERAFTRERSRGMQGLASAGLLGTTIAPTLGLSYTRQAAQEQGRLREALGLQQANLLGQQGAQRASLAGQQFAFQERRTDAFPSQGPFLALQQQAGEAQGAGLGAAQSFQPFAGRSAFGTSTGQSTYPGVTFMAPQQRGPDEWEVGPGGIKQRKKTYQRRWGGALQTTRG